ncbi:MAG: glutamine--tRNA ligase/YqeY domain fusion protein [Candidatus Cloacimonetes bacterium]|nr:glutamine--tRNA ligase/YqeY domain fusion protein [Candidatus Cloacimonadota bacterium]
MENETHPTNFIRAIIDKDIESGKYEKTVHTRFPPEPNGYLHIGHAKAICLSYGIAEDYNGLYNLRFDDTNPVKEETKYVESIKADIKWLGFDWENRLYFASDYFDTLYDYAVKLIKDGKAYVCDLNAEEIREYRGTLTEAGKNSPYRNRTIEENLELFEKMRNGQFENGKCTLRAKIDMASPNINLRDPIMYRILHTNHHRTGDKWCIYPSYDFTHGQCDSLENITHSLCDISFENHRPLYNWFIENLDIFPTTQIEFARLNITYTIMSKRKLRELVEGNFVNSWDDPRLPTLSGLRRRGYSPTAIRNFCDKIGLAKRISTVDLALLEYTLREDLNKIVPRVMAVLDPLKVIIDNFPEEQTDEMTAINNPEDESAGTRIVPFSKILYIEKNDFMEEPPKKFFRLSPGREIRLRYAYFVKCESVDKDETGNITAIHCTYDPETKGGSAPDGRKVKATMHWVSAKHAIDAEIRLYDNLFTVQDPAAEDDFKDFVNPNSLKILKNCKLEPSLKNAKPEEKFQFERLGYFCADRYDFSSENPVFNRTVTLRDTWAKIQKQQNKKKKM